ncbi:MAG: hypothetical protein ACLT98_03820 [Eggerthellaceae bacterium]
MSKKKMASSARWPSCCVPFLSGCAANDAEDNPQAQQELNAESNRAIGRGLTGDRAIRSGHYERFYGHGCGRHPRQCERR